VTQKLSLALAACLILSACGQGAPSSRAASGVANASVTAASARKLPMPRGGSLTDGFAAMRASAIADRALKDYVELTIRWERTYGDRAKDALEEQMLRTLKSALDDVQEVTSRQGQTSYDRQAYDLADRALDRYEALYREWRNTYGREAGRLVVNEMLRVMVDALEAIRDLF
jgi:hypothetical protein